MVTERTGLVFHPSRIEMVEARIVAAMERAGIDDPTAFAETLSADSLALDDLVAGLTIGETYFFREPAVFDFLRSELLPQIIRQRSRDHVLRVWSAGCASGEEAYSLAILLREAGWGEGSMVLGTDISRESLVKARRATYGSWSFRGTGESFVPRYFTAAGREFTLSETIRGGARFDYHNLALDTYPSLVSGIFGMDLILCRNVLIYFDPTAIRRVALRMYEALAEGGVLVTASADPPLNNLAPFTVVRSEAGIVYTRGRAGTMPAPARAAIPSPAWPVASADAPRKPRLKPAGKSANLSESSAVPVPEPVVNPVQQALAGGDHARVLEMVRGRADLEGTVLRVRALANTAGPMAAAGEAGRGMVRYPLSVEIAFLRAVLLAGAGRHAEAGEAARGALYLDRLHPAAHFVLGASLWNCGDLAGARREFGNARDLAAALSAGETIPFTEGETAGRLALGAAAQLAMLAPVASMASMASKAGPAGPARLAPALLAPVAGQASRTPASLAAEGGGRA
jgi:chemotaxis protein methyltransferase CheR